jgi:hypothetical protein
MRSEIKLNNLSFFLNWLVQVESSEFVDGEAPQKPRRGSRFVHLLAGQWSYATGKCHPSNNTFRSSYHINFFWDIIILLNFANRSVCLVDVNTTSPPGPIFLIPLGYLNHLSTREGKTDLCTKQVLTNRALGKKKLKWWILHEVCPGRPCL